MARCRRPAAAGARAATARTLDRARTSRSTRSSDDHLVGAAHAGRARRAGAGGVFRLSGGDRAPSTGRCRSGQRYTVWSYAPRPDAGASSPRVERRATRPALGRYLEVGPDAASQPVRRGGPRRAASTRSSTTALRRARGPTSRSTAGASGSRGRRGRRTGRSSRSRPGSASTGGFRYDEQPPPAGRAAAARRTSSTRTRRGYCQHFAGAMALMLRYLGHPGAGRRRLHERRVRRGQATGRSPTTTRTPGSRSGSRATAGSRSTRRPARRARRGLHAPRPRRSTPATRAERVRAVDAGGCRPRRLGELDRLGALKLGRSWRRRRHRGRRTTGDRALGILLRCSLVLAAALAIVGRVEARCGGGSRYLTRDPRRLAAAPPARARGLPRRPGRRRCRASATPQELHELVRERARRRRARRSPRRSARRRFGPPGRSARGGGAGPARAARAPARAPARLSRCRARCAGSVALRSLPRVTPPAVVMAAG